jgi:hypothetical protein
VLHLHDEAVNAVTVGHFSGPARIGMVQDFAETLLSGLLAQFSHSIPTPRSIRASPGPPNCSTSWNGASSTSCWALPGAMMLWPSTARRWAGMAGAICRCAHRSPGRAGGALPVS